MLRNAPLQMQMSSALNFDFFFPQDCWIRHFCHPDIGIYYLNMPYYQDTNCQDLTPFQLIYAGNNLVGFVFQHLAPLEGFWTFQPRTFLPQASILGISNPTINPNFSIMSSSFGFEMAVYFTIIPFSFLSPRMITS